MKKLLLQLIALTVFPVACAALSPTKNPEPLGNDYFESCWASSDYVIYGQVRGLEFIEGRKSGRPYIVTIKVSDNFKGEELKTIKLECDLGDIGSTSWGGERLNFSENYVIFAKHSETGNHTLIYSSQLNQLSEKMTAWSKNSLLDIMRIGTEDALIKFLVHKKTEPNQSTEPMPMAVTSPAAQASRQP